mgnify:CR=1 FL=1|tara:strand:- start:290 stop:820 length:531 start_codon:yes stop_codon:yes gene_type:complete
MSLILGLEINGVILMLVNGKDLYYWYDTNGVYNLKKPYWKLKKLYNDKGYLKTRIKGKLYYFHRIVYKAFNPDWDIEDNSKDNQIDHRDRNTLNNDISNLRKVNQQQNNFNRDFSWAKGYFELPSGRFQTRISVNDKNKNCGVFDTKLEARSKYIICRFLRDKLIYPFQFRMFNLN